MAADELPAVLSPVLRRVLNSQNHFETLGVPFDITQEGLKLAFHELVVSIHPDRCKHPLASKSFQQVSTAYRVLRCPSTRSQYMQTLYRNMALRAASPTATTSLHAHQSAAAAVPAASRSFSSFRSLDSTIFFRNTSTSKISVSAAGTEQVIHQEDDAFVLLSHPPVDASFSEMSEPPPADRAGTSRKRLPSEDLWFRTKSTELSEDPSPPLRSAPSQSAPNFATMFADRIPKHSPLWSQANRMFTSTHQRSYQFPSSTYRPIDLPGTDHPSLQLADDPPLASMKRPRTHSMEAQRP
jgi:curved DNA-binding protein CbpA